MDIVGNENAMNENANGLQSYDINGGVSDMNMDCNQFEPQYPSPFTQGSQKPQGYEQEGLQSGDKVDQYQNVQGSTEV